jgi:hypothetical protein
MCSWPDALDQNLKSFIEVGYLFRRVGSTGPYD